MKYIKKYYTIISFLGISCYGSFWHQNDTRVTNQILPTPDSMNQNLTVNLNYSPTQIKTPVIWPEKFFSNIPIKEWQAQTSNFLYKKRYFIAASLLFGGYVLACNYFVQANKYLEQPDIWSSWRPETPLDALLAIPQQELAKELILEIQRRYSNAQNPTDFISPLIAFIKAIDSEILIIKQYAEVYQWITKFHLQSALPINQKLFDQLVENNRKLIYLKNVFLSWAAEYKISHNKNKRQLPAFTTLKTKNP